MGVVEGLEEGDGVGGDGDFDGEEVGIFPGDLAVEAELDLVIVFFIGFWYYDCEGFGIGKDDGSIGEGVWADGGHGEDVGAGVDDGAAGGEVVGGGACGCGNDEAVGGVGGYELFIAVDLDVHKSGGGVVFDDDVVESEAFFFVSCGALEDPAFFELVFAFEDFGEASEGGFWGEGGEEAEFALVDAEDGDVGFDAGVDGSEDSAVSADDAADVLAMEVVFEFFRFFADFVFCAE